MRSASAAGSGLLALLVAAYFLLATVADGEDGLTLLGPAAIAVLVASLLLGADHFYLLLRSIAYCGRAIDSGRSWIHRRRQLVRRSAPAAASGLRSTAKRVGFTLAAWLLSPMVMITITVVAVIALLVVLIAGLAGAVPSGTAVLLASLVPFALVIAGLVMARAVFAAAVLRRRGHAAQLLVAFGRLPDQVPAHARGDFSVRAALASLSHPGPIATLVAAFAVPVFVAFDLRGVELGVLVGLLLLHLAVCNRLLYVGSRRWWRQLNKSSPDPETRFTRGTAPPTHRILVDIITPLGPGSDIAELGGVLSDHRALESAPVRWSIITEPHRSGEVRRFVDDLFALHGCQPPGSRVRVLALADTKAGPKRNHGAREATAPYVAFIDSDDRIDLLRLIAAVNTALFSEKSLQAVHLFPYFTQTSDGIRLRRPGAPHRAPITHHHCARLWPSGVFTAGIASYCDTDFEDAILIAEMATVLDHCLHKSAETAFMTYADHRNAAVRLTRTYKDASKLLNRLVHEAVEEVALPTGHVPSPRETALVDVFVRRVATEVTWGRETTPRVLRTALGEFEPYRHARRGEVEVSRDVIAATVEEVRRRSASVRAPDADLGLISFLRDELAARVSRTMTLTASDRDPDVERTVDERQLGLFIGLMSAGPSGIRPRADTPTILYNLREGDRDPARRSIHFYAREPHFNVRPDPKLPLGEVVVRDPIDGSRHRVGSFERDRLMSSALLRLWDRFFPSMTDIERSRAHVILHDLGVTSQSTVVRLVGTGPSSMGVLEDGSTRPDADVTTICCNSWVRQPERMAEMGAKMLTAGDPIFHAGPSEYARQFRSDLTAWLRRDPEHLFLTVSRDVSVYLSELPIDVHEQMVAVAFDASIDPNNPVSIGTGRVQPYPNVLTLLMLPLAERLSPSTVWLYGFDGGARGVEQYWTYDPGANYSEELQETVRRWHPEFFRLDYDEYRDQHYEHVDGWIRRLNDQGVVVRSGAPSNIPAVDAAFEVDAARAGVGADGDEP